MLQPNRVKYRRPHIIKYEGKATSGNTVAFGEFGLEALEGAWITTKKAAGTRMGSGKGSPEDWVAVVRQGCIMFEMSGIAEDQAREALRLAAYKLPIKCKVVKKGEE